MPIYGARTAWQRLLHGNGRRGLQYGGQHVRVVQAGTQELMEPACQPLGLPLCALNTTTRAAHARSILPIRTASAHTVPSAKESGERTHACQRLDNGAAADEQGGQAWSGRRWH